MKERAVRLIKDAYLELNETIPAGKITVKNLTQKAGISRATFYTYFENVDSLVDEMEDVLLADVEEILDMWQYVNFERFDGVNPIPNVQMLSKYVDKNMKAFRVLAGENGRPSFAKRLMDTVYTSIHAKWVQEGYSRDWADVLSALYAGAISQLCKAWAFGQLELDAGQVALIVSSTLSALQKEFSKKK